MINLKNSELEDRAIEALQSETKQRYARDGSHWEGDF